MGQSEVKVGVLNVVAEEAKEAFDAEASFQVLDLLIDQLTLQLPQQVNGELKIPEEGPLRKNYFSIKRYLEKIEFSRKKGRITYETIQELTETTQNFLEAVKKKEQIDNDAITLNQKKLEEIVDLSATMVIDPTNLTPEHAKLLDKYFNAEEKKLKKDITKNKAYGDDINFYRFNGVNFSFKKPLVRLKKLYARIKVFAPGEVLPETKDADTLYLVKTEDGGAIVSSAQEDLKVLTAAQIAKLTPDPENPFSLNTSTIINHKQIQALMRLCDYSINYVYQTYDLQKRLGNGNFGVVYESLGRLERSAEGMKYQEFTSPQVMKVQEIKEEDQEARAAAVERVKQEGEIWKTLDETAREEKAPLSQTKKPTSQRQQGKVRKMYMAQRKITGCTLDKYIPREGGPNNLTNQQLYGITIGLLQAAKRMHKAGIVHRDLKPQNIMIDDSTKPYTVTILDVGLSVKQNTPAGFSGTRRYMPPELYADSAHYVDVSHDYFSIGVLLRNLWTDSVIAHKDRMLNEIIPLTYYSKAEYWLNISTPRADLSDRLIHSNMRSDDSDALAQDAKTFKQNKSYIEDVLTAMTASRPEERMSIDGALRWLGKDPGEPIKTQAPEVKEAIDSRETGFGSGLLIVSIADDKDISEALSKARHKNAPLIIKKGSEYFIYGKPRGASQWVQTPINDPTILAGLSPVFDESQKDNIVIRIKTYADPSYFTEPILKLARSAHDNIGECLDRLPVNLKKLLLDELIINAKAEISSSPSYFQEYMHLLTVAVQHQKISDKNLKHIIQLTHEVLLNAKKDENNISKFHVDDLRESLIAYPALIQKAWQQTFLPDKKSEDIKNTRFAEYFLGWPEKNGRMAKAAYLVTLGWLFTPLKNTVKWVAEFLPKAASVTCDFLNFQVSTAQPTHPVGKFLQWGASKVLNGGIYLFDAVNLLARTVTSPITSWREAKRSRYGDSLALVSAACSITGFVALSVVALPAVIGAVAAVAPQLGIAGALQMIGSPFAGLGAAIQGIAPAIAPAMGMVKALGAVAIATVTNLCFLGNGIRENKTEKALQTTQKELAIQKKQEDKQKKQQSMAKIANLIGKEKGAELMQTIIEKKIPEKKKVEAPVPSPAVNSDKYTPTQEAVIELSQSNHRKFG